MKNVVIAYGSTGGNTEFTVELVSEFLSKAGHAVSLRRVEKYNYSELLKEILTSDLFIVASPTYGHGQLQEDMIPFMNSLKKEDLSNVTYAVIGLGDAKYDSHYHIESTFILEDILNKCGAKKLQYALRISKSPMLQVDNLIPKWSKKLLSSIKTSL